MDLIIYNGEIHTMDEGNPIVSAVSIKGGIIEQTGSDSEILKLKTESAKLIDLKGKLAVPGFNDSHLHLLGYAASLSEVNLTGSKSPDEIAAKIKAFIEENNIAPGVPVFGYGWNQNFFNINKYPTCHDLDKASTTHPIVITRACHHVEAVNSYTLKKFNIDENTVYEGDGEIEKDEKGFPTGIVTENARRLLDFKEEVSAQTIEADIIKALPYLAEMGITSVQSDDFSAGILSDIIKAYSNLAESKKLTVRVNQQCRSGSLEGYKQIVSLPKTDESIRPYYKIGPVKVMGDGSLGARTAFMACDYKDAPGSKGIPIYPQDIMDEIAALAHGSDKPLAIHAIGDGAMDMALKAVEKAQKGNPKPNIRHGIVHCQITDKALLNRFKENNIVAYIQPIFIHADWPIVESRVGREKADTSYAYKTLRDMGLCTPFGTDCPVEEFNPFKNIYCAVTRKDLEGNPKEGYNINEALTVHEAVYCYTADGAYTSYEEGKKGKIKEGMYADLVVLSKNIFNTPPEEILNTKVDLTVFDGKVIFERKS